jgi:hypothetical protein
MSTNGSVHKEAFWLLCDDRLGGGMSREVYSSKLMPDSVIKIEDVSCHFQNVIEWETWQMVRNTPAEKWFAPCEFISPCGVILVMAKTIQSNKYPEKMPVFLSDFKKGNYGLYRGNLVCHDYGTNLSMHHGLFTKRVRKANWS